MGSAKLLDIPAPTLSNEVGVPFNPIPVPGSLNLPFHALVCLFSVGGSVPAPRLTDRALGIGIFRAVDFEFHRIIMLIADGDALLDPGLDFM